MAKSEIIMIDGVPAISLSQGMLDALGLQVGDDVEIVIMDRQLIIQSIPEIERAAKMQKIFNELMIERESLYRRLAEGVK